MRYLVVPKDDPDSDILTDPRLRAGPGARRERYDRLIEARRSRFERAGTLESMAAAMGPEMQNVAFVASPSNATPATGITIIEADETGANAVAEISPDSELVPDEPLDLIAPEFGDALGGAGGGAIDVTEDDLWHLEAIGLLDARRRGFGLTGAGTTVAVLDTGVADVPELAGRIIDARTLDLDNWTTNPQPVPEDTDRHGTHVACLIAGQNVGVAPGAKIASVVMIPNGRGTLASYVLALEWVASRPDIAILNMSAGRQGYFPNMRLMARIAARLGTLSVMAIGNEGAQTTRSPGNYPEVISVGASTVDRDIWHRSGGGTLTIDGVEATVPMLVAPGEDVCSAVPGGGYQLMSGTSMAAPIVSGLAALLIERFPAISLAELQEALLETCVDLGFDASRQGRGLVQLPHSFLDGLPQ
ncbi:S8 family peptidase [Acuticoccus kandeliae]|uniref:S8 family peptidase n=1 Tax=Acuticoccus kandeliae TaxID=2073160 RepID=UPI000D3E7017|nr:S8 family serine peptidase [Acuticoccus kandeliae]